MNNQELKTIIDNFENLKLEGDDYDRFIKHLTEVDTLMFNKEYQRKADKILNKHYRRKLNIDNEIEDIEIEIKYEEGSNLSKKEAFIKYILPIYVVTVILFSVLHIFKLKLDTGFYSFGFNDSFNPININFSFLLILMLLAFIFYKLFQFINKGFKIGDNKINIPMVGTYLISVIITMFLVSNLFLANIISSSTNNDANLLPYYLLTYFIEAIIIYFISSLLNKDGQLNRRTIKVSIISILIFSVSTQIYAILLLIIFYFEAIIEVIGESNIHLIFLPFAMTWLLYLIVFIPWIVLGSYRKIETKSLL